MFKAGLNATLAVFLVIGWLNAWLYWDILASMTGLLAPFVFGFLWFGIPIIVVWYAFYKAFRD